VAIQRIRYISGLTSTQPSGNKEPIMFETRLRELLAAHPLAEFIELVNGSSWPQLAVVLRNPYGVKAEGRSSFVNCHYHDGLVITKVHLEGLDSINSEVNSPTAGMKTQASELAALGFALQSTVIPSLYCGWIKLSLDELALEEASAEAVLRQLVFFYYVQWFERNNLRYCLGMGANGYAMPHIAHRKFYSDKIGDYASDAQMPLFLYASFRNMGVHPHVVDYLVGDIVEMPDIELWRPYLPRVDQYDKTILNMSFGKESLFVYELLERQSKLFTFSHDYASTDYERRARKLDKSASHMVCDYLPAILDPVGNQLLPGAPIHTLFIPHMMAQCTALHASEFTHILFGDEFERSISMSMIDFADKGRSEAVFTYDFNQTPRFAIAFNACKHFDWPAVGSVMYNLTGLQAQMLFDASGSDILQTSCHPSLMTGKNCGKCAKCHRVGVRKKVVGTMANVDYDISWDAALDTCNWTLLEYYGHGDSYGKNEHLYVQHAGMYEISMAQANPGTEVDRVLFGDFWESMGTLIDDLPNLLSIKHTQVLKERLAEVSLARKKDMEASLLLR
jgi:hypothetical protein